jgi:hypothetical protein
MENEYPFSIKRATEDLETMKAYIAGYGDALNSLRVKDMVVINCYPSGGLPIPTRFRWTFLDD